mgnify:CR=1 FL=1
MIEAVTPNKTPQPNPPFTSLEANPNKKDLPYPYVEKIKSRFIRPTYSESQNHIDSVLFSRVRTGQFWPGLPLFPLAATLTKHQIDALNDQRSVLQYMLDSGFFLYLYKCGKKKFSFYSNKAFKEGIIMNPWKGTVVFTLQGKNLKQIKMIPSCFRGFPGQVNPQGFLNDAKDFLTKYKGQTLMAVGAGIIAVSHFDPVTAVALGMLGVGTYYSIPKPTEIIGSSIHSAIKDSLQIITKDIKESLQSNKVLYGIAFFGVVVSGYALYRMVYTHMFSPDMVKIYLSGEYGVEFPAEVTPHGSSERTTGRYLALMLIALATGVSATTVLRNYSSCKTVFKDIDGTFTTDNVKSLINWLGNLAGVGDLCVVDDFWARVTEAEKFIGNVKFNTKIVSSKKFYKQFIEHVDYLNAVDSSYKKDWSHDEVRRYTAVLLLYQRAYTTYKSANPALKKRPPPTSIMLRGPSDQGKSALVRIISKLIHKMSRPSSDSNIPTDTYTFIPKRGSNFPWEGYNPSIHLVCLDDDFMQNADGTLNGKDLQELFSLLEDRAHILETAFHDKGTVHYHSEAHIITTNVSKTTNFGITSPDAFFKRLDIAVEVKLDRPVGVDATDTDVMNSWTFTEITDKGYKPTLKGSFGLKDLLALVVKKYRAHRSYNMNKKIGDMMLPKTTCASCNVEFEIGDDHICGASKSVLESTSESSSGSDWDYSDSEELLKSNRVEPHSELKNGIYISKSVNKGGMFNTDLTPHDLTIKYNKCISDYEDWPVFLNPKHPMHDKLTASERDLMKRKINETNLIDEKIDLSHIVIPMQWDISINTKCAYVGSKVLETMSTTCLFEDGRTYDTYATQPGPGDTYLGKNISPGYEDFNIPAIVFVSGNPEVKYNEIRKTCWMISVFSGVGTFITMAIMYAAIYCFCKVVGYILKSISSMFSFLVEPQSATGEYEKAASSIKNVRLNTFKKCACNVKMHPKYLHCGSCGSKLPTSVSTQSKTRRPLMQEYFPNDDVDRKVCNNIFSFTVSRSDGSWSTDHILMIDETQGFVAAHSLDDAEDILTISIQRSEVIGLILEPDNYVITRFPKEHTALITFKTRKLACVRSIKKLLPENKVNVVKNSTVHRRDLSIGQDGNIEVNFAEGTIVCDTYKQTYMSAGKPFYLTHGICTDIMKNEKGMCGSPYFGQNTDNGKYQVMFIHVAADSNGASLASAISQDMIPTGTHEIVENQNVVFTASSCTYPKGTIPAGKIDTYYFAPNKTDYVPSLFREAFPDVEVETHFPLVEEPPMHAMWQSTRFKYHKGVCYPEVLSEFYKANIHKVMKDFMPINPCVEISMEDAIFGNGRIGGVDMTTSTGPYWRKRGITDRKELFDPETKWILPEFQERVQKYYDDAGNGHWEEFVCVLALKDEPLPFKKDIKRVFYIYDVDLLVFMRMVLGDMVQNQIENHNVSGCAIGINPHGIDWTLLVQKMLPYYKYLLSDYSKLDVTLQEFMFTFASWYVIDRFQATGKAATRIESIFTRASSPLLIAGNNAFRAIALNTSGWLWTLGVNDFSCHHSHNMCINMILCDDLSQFFKYSDQYKLVSYGDDMWKGFTEKLANRIKPSELSRLMAKYYGLTLTGIDKTDAGHYVKHIEDCSFIGRTFKLKGSLYLAPLQDSSFNKMIHWIRKNKKISAMEIYQSILNTMCHESIPKGKYAYNDFLKRMHPLLIEFDLHPLYTTYAQAWARYKDNYLNSPRSEIAQWLRFNKACAAFLD